MNARKTGIIGVGIAILLPFGFWMYYNIIVGFPKRLPRWYPTGETIKIKDGKGKERIDSVYHTIADFKLTDQNGKIITNDSFKNKIYVADFIFCSCPKVCPELTKNMWSIQEEFKNVKWIELLSHTVDPEHDSIGRLKQYAQKFHADDSKWHFARGSWEEIRDLGMKSYYLSIQQDGPESFDHSEKFVLVDNHRIIRGYYGGRDTADLKRLKKDIVILLKELSNDVNELRPPKD